MTIQTYIIYENGEEINRIVADEEFIAGYTAENGYTAEAVPGTEVEENPELDNLPDEEELMKLFLGTSEMAAAITEGVNGV